jgi:YD repeat-containing protein
MKFFKGSFVILAGVIIAISIMACDNTKYAKKSTENIALLALLKPAGGDTACGVPLSSGNLFLSQITFFSGVSAAIGPWKYSDCKPSSALITGSSLKIASITVDTAPGIVKIFSYDSAGRITTITDTGQKTITNGTAANATTGCPACTVVGGCPTNVVETTAFTYNSGNNVATRAVSQVCGLGINTTPGDVETDTITYNSDNNITSYSVQQNLDQTLGAQTVATLSANPVMVITNTYMPASGNPTQVVQAIQTNQINCMGGGTAPFFYVSKSVVSTTAGYTNTYTVPMSSEQLVAKNPPTGAETCNGYSVKAAPGATTDVIGLINVCTSNGPVISSLASPYLPGTTTTVSNVTANLYGTKSTYTLGLDSMSRLDWFQVTLVGNWTGAVPSKSTGLIMYDDQGRVRTIESSNAVAGANYDDIGLMSFMNLNNGTIIEYSR